MPTDTPPKPASHWENPAVFLACVSFLNVFGFAGWNALLNNFALERAGFTWFETGLTQSVREIPGFLAFTAIFFILYLREQTFAYLSLIVLCLGIAITGYFPTLTGILITTYIMSVGFHYFETMNQSLTLQLISKREAPRIMGRIQGTNAAAQFIAFGGVALAWYAGFTSYEGLFLIIGAISLLGTVVVMRLFKKFDGTVPQRKQIILRSRYWLYYALTFMSGARRQIFTAFAGFLLVKKFGFSVSETAILMLVTAALTTVIAPRFGVMVSRIGERNTIMLENIALIIVFAGYALTSSGWIAGALYVMDGICFTLNIAQRTYFQKIGDPADMAPTSAVAFTINHIAAVVIPVTFGLLGNVNPSMIFWLGVLIASISLLLSFLVPHDPGPGRETTLSPGGAMPVAQAA